jgi:hypothetical protein
MELTPGNADTIAIEMIQMLIQTAHYKTLGYDDAIVQIGKDTNALAAALTNSQYKRT